MAGYMLTTTDNPFDPFTQYDEWNSWDEANGYYTNAYLARVARVSLDLSEADLDFAYEVAVEEIFQENVNGMYRKVPAPYPGPDTAADAEAVVAREPELSS